MRGHMDTSENGLRDVAGAAKRSWRRHSAEFKARVIELARQPGTSVAAVALANGLNANMLRHWVHDAATGGGALKTTLSSATPARASFMQLPMLEAAPKARKTPAMWPCRPSHAPSRRRAAPRPHFDHAIELASSNWPPSTDVKSSAARTPSQFRRKAAAQP